MSQDSVATDASWSDPASSRVRAAIPPAASEPAGQGLSPRKVVATPPQPLCLCDPEGTECGNGAGGHGAQRLGRGGVSGHCPSSCRSLVWSWSSGQREGLQTQGQVSQLAPGSRRGCWGVAALVSRSPPPGPGSPLLASLPCHGPVRAAVHPCPGVPAQPARLLGACEAAAQRPASPNCGLLSGPSPSWGSCSQHRPGAP